MNIEMSVLSSDGGFFPVATQSVDHLGVVLLEAAKWAPLLRCCAAVAAESLQHHGIKAGLVVSAAAAPRRGALSTCWIT